MPNANTAAVDGKRATPSESTDDSERGNQEVEAAEAGRGVSECVAAEATGLARSLAGTKESSGSKDSTGSSSPAEGTERDSDGVRDASLLSAMRHTEITPDPSALGAVHDSDGTPDPSAIEGVAPSFLFRSVREAESIAQALRFIEDQIKCIIQQEHGLVYNRYRLDGVDEMRQGGEGVVQHATCRFSGKPYALKFFACHSAFMNERTFYVHEALQKALPHSPDIFSNSVGSWKDPHGRELAPCVVMERGEPLDQWLCRVTPDLASAMQIMCGLVAVVADLHAAGFVHRDIKPSNTLWLPSRKHWSVIDFGCAAIEGHRAHIKLSLAYAAPESAVAYEKRERYVVASSAVDVWSLGVMAFEIFTGTQVFKEGTRKREMVGALAGRSKLPWEDDSSKEWKATMKKLGAMRKDVLSMLHRNPAKRAKLSAIQARWSTLFDQSTAQFRKHKL